MPPSKRKEEEPVKENLKPKTGREFLGLIEYHRRPISKFVACSKPLTELLKQGKDQNNC